MRTILGIWAHPDDEVFVSGGVMADAVRRGDRVVCLHMTRGEAGLLHRKTCSPEQLGAIRERELADSLGCLGIDDVRFFDYPDGRLGLVPSDEAVARLHASLVEIKPDVILTFGSDGFTGHPDHKVLSSWVTRAVRQWNRRRTRLYQVTVPADWKSSIVPRLNEFDFFWPGYPLDGGRADVTLHLDDDLLEAKVAAIRAHSSQMEPLFAAYGDGFMRTVAATEHFRFGPRPAFRTRVLTDLSHR